MKLWTIVDQYQMDYIEKHGFLRADGRKVYNGFRDAYDWLNVQMHQQVGPPPKNFKYPIWAWYQWEGEDRMKPDLRAVRHYWGDGVMYRLELDIPDEQVLLSDYATWHHVLNKWHLCFTEHGSNAFDDRYLDGWKMGQWDTYSEPMQNEIVESWQQIFDLTGPRDEDWVGKIKDMEIQATFWILHEANIKKIDKYVAERKD